MNQAVAGSEPHSLRNVLVVLGAIWVALMAYNLLSQVSGYFTVHDFHPNFLSQLVYLTLKVWLPWAVISPLVVWLARRFPMRPENWVRLALLHMFFLLVLSLLVTSVLSFHYHYREEMAEMMHGYEPWQHIGHYLFGDRLFLYNAVIYTVFLATFNIRNFYELAQARELDSARLIGQLNEAQLRALKMQVNPHFLFNTLNAISVLVMKGDNRRAGEMITLLGDFFRTNLEENDAQWVPVARELEMVERYLAIERIRFGDRLKIVERYDAAAMGYKVPSMILQPLVENAIRHGLGNHDGGFELTIETRMAGDRLLLRVADTGAGCDFDAEYREGVGIGNVRERLTQLFADNFSFRLTGRVGEGVAAEIDLPALERPRRAGWVRV
ncbi:MAG: histidine kinase [Pseudomonadota bacterium]